MPQKSGNFVSPEKRKPCAIATPYIHVYFTIYLRYALKSHMVMHSDERPHKCDLCGKTFARRDSLKLHGYSHKTEKPFICTYCGKAFVSKYRLHAHTLRHEKKFPCNVCGKSYFANWALRKHMQLHTGMRRMCVTNVVNSSRAEDTW